MKNNNFINAKILMVGLVITISTSCKKIIEIPAPTNKISTAQIFSDSVSTMGAVAGVYSNFGVANSGYNNLVFMNGLITVTTGLSGDELLVNSFDADLPAIEHNKILTSNGQVALAWSNAYKCIYQVNACIEGITSSTGLSASLKQQLTGELKVVRALYYFNLVNLYGAVPLVTSTDYNVNKTLPRAATVAVYAQIITDLEDAKTKLSANYPSDGKARPNVYSANALLAKVYLYQGQWQKAYALSNEVINSGTYQLENDLNNVFIDASGEAIWQLPANGTNNQTPEAFKFVPAYNFEPPEFVLTDILLNTFETNDQRKQNWIDSIIVNINGANQTFYYPYKYKNTRPASSTTTEDYMILRLAEQYLIRAEANAHLNNLQAALADVDVIRNRAGLPNSNALTQTDILSAIMHERQVELFCEFGNRWYDLKRTATINNILGSEKTGWQATDSLYPIPAQEILSNPALIQNPGY